MKEKETIKKAKSVISEQKKIIKQEKKKINKKKKKKLANCKVVTFLKKINIFKKSEKENYSFNEVIIIMLFSLGIGFFACFSFIKIFNGGKDYIALSKDLDKLVDTYYAIIDNYYGDLDKAALVDSAIKGMISSIGDVYTNYSDSDDALTFNETVGGTYEGIGATVANNLEGDIIVVSIFEDGPAFTAGLKEGDIILTIDNEDYRGKTSTDVANYIKNSDKEKVVFTILREDEEKEITIKLSKIEIPSVTTKVFEENDKKIGYIDIDIFSAVTNHQFEDALKKLEKDGIDALVIDVRNNGGGYLNVVTDIASLFLEKGEVIYQLEDSNGTDIKKDTTKTKRTYKIAILTNGSSASASEILAAAIKESYGGYVVGVNTFGKGTVQQTTTLPDGSMVKYTVQNWLTPDGNWLDKVGLEPTNVVELSEAYYENPCDDTDNQLQEALSLVSK